MGTSDKVWRSRPPPSVTHSPETPMGGGEGAAEKEAGGPGRARPPEQSRVKGTATTLAAGGGGAGRGGTQGRGGKVGAPGPLWGRSEIGLLRGPCGVLVPGEAECGLGELFCW